mgnify:CR=1 FL=1
MQFRKQKTLVQVMRYSGYDAAKKQPKVEMVGTIDLQDFLFTPKDDVVLSGPEKHEINVEANVIRLQTLKDREIESVQAALSSVAALHSADIELIKALAKSSDQKAIYNGCKAVLKALKNGGFSARGKAD